MTRLSRAAFVGALAFGVALGMAMLMSTVRAAVPEDAPGNPAAAKAETVVASAAGGAAGVSPLFAGRLAANRLAALAAEKAPPVAEASVTNALRWLKARQHDAGSWSGQAEAMTGFALLAFLGHGETTASPEFGPAVEKAIRFLIGRQEQMGKTNYTAEAYGNGIATIAMCEAAGMTGLPEVKASAGRAIQGIIEGQEECGGFTYAYQKGPRWDTSVAGWQFQALKAAKMAGLGNAQLDQAIDKAVRFLTRNSFNPQSGSFSYSANGSDVGSGGSWTMTGAGVSCLQMLGQGDAPEVRAGLKFLEKQTVQWKGSAPGQGMGINPVYGWYYVTAARHRAGGSAWDEWNSQFAAALAGAQGADGHWEGGDFGSAAKAPEVYTTGLCTLMLESYYR